MLKLEPCVPPFWASTGHVQTILGHVLPSPKLSHKGRRVEIPVDNGDRLVGFILDGRSTTIVYIFHGLAGSTDSTYVHRTAMVAQTLGHSVFLLNHRGCGEGAGLAVGPYHSGRAEDLAAAIAAGKAMYPRHRHVAIGFSMSGNALLLLLTGVRGDTKPDAAISVNAPIHLERSAHLLKTGLNHIYDIKFYLQCRRDILAAQNRILKQIKMPKLTTLYELDKLYTAPAAGFADREDYYHSCSTYTLLDRIQIPTIAIISKDDPFVAFETYKSARLSKNVHLHVENFGGHMGYLSRQVLPLGTRRWQDYALFESLKVI